MEHVEEHAEKGSISRPLKPSVGLTLQLLLLRTCSAACSQPETSECTVEARKLERAMDAQTPYHCLGREMRKHRSGVLQILLLGHLDPLAPGL